MNIPQIDADVLNGWGKLRSGASFDQLNEAEQTKVGYLNNLVDQYIAADKYAFVSLMWNLSFPIGLLTGKKGLHIQASGGIYTKGPGANSEYSHNYLKRIFEFVGITSVEAIFVEGITQMPEKAQSIKEKAIEEAQELAKRF